MVESKDTERRGHGRRRAESEKRRIVELALRGEAPLRAIARDHGICHNTLRRWMERYRGETSNGSAQPRGRTLAAGATFLPITIAGAARAQRQAPGGGSSVEITLASGMSLRIDAATLDTHFICALIAELRR